MEHINDLDDDNSNDESANEISANEISTNDLKPVKKPIKGRKKNKGRLKVANV